MKSEYRVVVIGGGEEALRQARAGPRERDEPGVDRGTLQSGDQDRERGRAPGPVARRRLDSAAHAAPRIST